MAKNSPQDIKNRLYFSARLNRLMKEQGKRQIDLHNDLGIPKSTLTGYVKGRSMPNTENLQKLADYFKVEVSDIDPRYFVLEPDVILKNEQPAIDFVTMFESLSGRKQKKYFKDVIKDLEHDNLPHDFLKEPSDLVTHLGLQLDEKLRLDKELKILEKKHEMLEEEIRVLKIAHEYRLIDPKDTEAINDFKNKLSEEDIIKLEELLNKTKKQ
jgi:transcriptional regulator with XRE-family HTH domain